jgi:hypothetical protein
MLRDFGNKAVAMGRIGMRAWQRSAYTSLYINLRITFHNDTCLLTQNFSKMIDPFTPSVLRPLPKTFRDSIPPAPFPNVGSFMEYAQCRTDPSALQNF